MPNKYSQNKTVEIQNIISILRTDEMTNCAAHAIDIQFASFNYIHKNVNNCIGFYVSENELKDVVNKLISSKAILQYSDKTYSLSYFGVKSIEEADKLKLHNHPEYYNKEDNLHKNNLISFNFGDLSADELDDGK